jgi:hypothetical protein
MSRPRPQLDYARLQDEFQSGAISVSELAERLLGGWAEVYRAATAGTADPVEVDQSDLTYLFDIANERVVGVCGSSASPPGAYPSSRMRGFPLPIDEARRLIRGHLAAHSIGGGPDINLVPQDRALNVSAGWRRLERFAQRHPGSFVAVEVIYDDESQTPARFVYLVAENRVLEYEHFENS